MKRQKARIVESAAAYEIVNSAAAYDKWLGGKLNGSLVECDLADKHEKMAADPFQFLRATYWRWAEMILEKCPELANAPQVVSVGDIHVENFGTWRDLEGRVIWGVNDFDEAAEMPYIVDLVRLAVSAVLAGVTGMTPAAVCANVLKGYRRGLKQPTALVLDVNRKWLRRKFVVNEDERADFWSKMTPEAEAEKLAKRAEKRKKKNEKVEEICERPKRAPENYRTALTRALPKPGPKLTYWFRTAGTGSLGRPRWVARGDWRGSPVLREAKAIVPSGWTIAPGRPAQPLWCKKIAFGKYRAGDPWYDLRGTILVRRLSPNNRKLDLGEVKRASELVNARMLRYMGRDLAAIHLGLADHRRVIAKDLRGRVRSFRKSVRTALQFVREDFGKWQEHWAERRKADRR
jgi:hypothetical protein